MSKLGKNNFVCSTRTMRIKGNLLDLSHMVIFFTLIYIRTYANI